jgi:putative resolvase
MEFVKRGEAIKTLGICYQTLYKMAERKGLQELMVKAINGEIEELVIAYKDRLTRFGYEMTEWLISKYSNGKIIVINKNEEKTPVKELTKDIVSIMNVYVAKVNGLRKYKTHIKE